MICLLLLLSIDFHILINNNSNNKKKKKRQATKNIVWWLNIKTLLNTNPTTIYHLSNHHPISLSQIPLQQNNNFPQPLWWQRTRIPLQLSQLRNVNPPMSLTMSRFISHSNFWFHFTFSQNLYLIHDAVSSFHSLLHMNPTPSIVQFNKILGFLAKTKNHYTSVISLSDRLEFNGITPDIATLSILINCYSRPGQINFDFLWQKMFKFLTNITDKIEKNIFIIYSIWFIKKNYK